MFNLFKWLLFKKKVFKYLVHQWWWGLTGGPPGVGQGGWGLVFIVVIGSYWAHCQLGEKIIIETLQQLLLHSQHNLLSSDCRGTFLTRNKTNWNQFKCWLWLVPTIHNPPAHVWLQFMSQFQTLIYHGDSQLSVTEQGRPEWGGGIQYKIWTELLNWKLSGEQLVSLGTNWTIKLLIKSDKLYLKTMQIITFCWVHWFRQCWEWEY